MPLLRSSEIVAPVAINISALWAWKTPCKEPDLMAVRRTLPCFGPNENAWFMMLSIHIQELRTAHEGLAEAGQSSGFGLLVLGTTGAFTRALAKILEGKVDFVGRR